MSASSIVYMFTASLIALFPVMNPVGNGFIVNSFLSGTDPSLRRTYSKKIFSNALLVGLGSLAAGHLVLLVFGLAVPVIQMGGGLLICKTGLELLSDRPVDSARNEVSLGSIDPDSASHRLFYPISFPISIGPGSISVIFTLMATAVQKGNILSTGINYAVIGLVIFLLCAVLYLFISQGDRITRRLGESANLIINKMVAFLTFCVGIQILMNGIGRAFHITVL
ncbi:MAG: MarC family protein [Rikenellaceae bacterium]|nr:MarC family protein [Rikenellaceae bacterium]